MQQEDRDRRAVGSVRLWESVVAVLLMAFGALIAWDSHRIGSTWGDNGPRAGYFPFYVGLFILVSGTAILYSALRMSPEEGREPFVRWGELRMVLTVFVPSIVYVALIDNPWYPLGIYVPSALFIGAFMRYLGRYGWLTVVAVSVGVMVAFFLMFEIWFQVPLPKGPLETALGFG
ncbi:MAG TPA: tripartite tricarboxylate transporter TctB family protein [Usitatibacter sp.]|nr:tripartite tricarboxylate transporter TctB family protein [Usitatibacter sp.]